MREIRVLHIVTGMGLGGAEKVAVQLATARGSSAAVAWLTGPLRWEEPLAQAGVACHPVGMRRPWHMPQAVLRLRALIRQFRPDIVHTHLIHANLAGRRAARLAGDVPVVSTEHNLGYQGVGARWLVPLDARTSRRNRAVVAISEAVRARCLSAGFRPDTLCVVYNGVTLPASLPPPPDARKPLLVMVGRLHPDKGADIFIDIVERLPSVAGRLVGDGKERANIRRLIEVSPARERLQWEPEGDAACALGRATVVVVPSRREGLGIVPLEAMALARPVVAARVGGLVEVVEDGVTGLLVAPEAGALVASVQRLLDQPERLVEMGRAGRQRVEERFTLNRMLDGYEAIYRRVAVSP